MARTYPLTVGYNESMGSKENPLSFASLRLVDLRNSQSQYLSTMKQLIDALPKTVDHASRFALRGHFARPGHPRLRHSMRAAMWFLLPSDGTFRRDSTSLQYYLTRQGRRVVLRGGDVTGRPLDRRLNWIPDQPPPLPEIMAKEMKRITLLHLSLPSYPEKERTSSEASSRHQWRCAWNRPQTQGDDADPSEASPASTASAASLPSSQ